jgi:SNF2 family DNA or RNA helicase
MRLRPYQEQMVSRMLDQPRTAIWAGMGLGKTSATLHALDALLLAYGGSALVLAPLRVAQSTWPDEVQKWPSLRHLRVVPIIGDAKTRRAAMHTPGDIFTINYENLPWLVETWGEDWPYTIVVADESTRLKSFRLRQGGKRAQALAKVSAKIQRHIQLTGTPSPNGLIDLWGQIWFVDQGQRLGRSFSAFTSRWFRQIPVGDGFSKLEPHAHAQGEIEERLRDVCMSLDARDHFDLREPIVNVIKTDLPAELRKKYEELEKQFFTEIDGEEIEAVSAAAKSIKCLQFANGALYTDDGSWVEAHGEKIEALHSIVEEAAGAPILVAYHFKSDLARLKAAFPQGRHLDKDPQTIKDWNAGKIPLLFAHPASAGHGLSLQDGGNILVFFGLWWDLEQHLQIIERIGPTRQAQSGYDRPVFIHYLVGKKTVDELVLTRLTTKKSVQEILLEAMK